MAQVHNQLTRGQLSRALTLALGDRRGNAGIERFGETMQPVIDLWQLPEWAVYRDERLAGVRTFQPAVAAEFGGIALVNPVGSNMIVVVEAISIGAATAVSCFLESVADTVIAGTLATVTTPTASRDRRFQTTATGNTRASFRQGTDPTNTFGVQHEQQSALVTPAAMMSPFLNALPLILPPGMDALVIAQTVNIAFSVNWAWRERTAFPGELG